MSPPLERLESPRLNFDYRIGAIMAAEHLISFGNRKICFATTPMTRWSRHELFRGYKEALVNAGIGFEQSFLFESNQEFESETGNYELEAGSELAEMFAHRNVGATAVLCTNDMVAISFLKTLKRSEELRVGNRGA